VTRGVSARPRRALREIHATDVDVYRAIASSHTPALDRALRRLSRTADHSVLWGGVALALSTRPGRSRQAAVLGVASIGVASAVANIVGKQLLPRSRPDRLAAAVPLVRQVRMPASGSFPSGHAASAFAFASAVGGRLPWLSFPLYVLAVAVAYSRVHTGVHYPTDTVIGAVVGSASAAATSYVANRLTESRT
jgi:undecaprenyl-diphosphatase